MSFDTPESQTPAPWRIGAIDDHDMVLYGLKEEFRRFAEGKLELVATANTVEEFLGQGIEADLVLLDLRLADDTLPNANVATLRDAGYQVLALTSGENPYLIRLAAESEVLGVLPKSTAPERSMEIIAQAAQGEVIASLEWAAALDSAPDLSKVGLSSQQRSVLELYASGAEAAQVASALDLKPSTVHDYIKSIRLKFATAGRPAGTKQELYMRAVEDGYLPPPSS